MRYSICARCGITAAVNSDNLCYGCLRRRAGVHMGVGAASECPGMDGTVKRFTVLALSVGLSALVFASSALAVTVPDIPVAAYGNSLLTGLAAAVTDVLPYAAAITAFAIGVGMIRRWLGAKKATRV